MKTRALITGVIALTLSPTSFAENWVSVGASVSGSEFLVDTDSIVVEVGYVEYWITVDSKKDASVDYRETKALRRAKCGQRRLATVYRVEYMPDGSNNSYGPWDYPTFSPAVPGSMGQAETEFVCAIANSS